MTELVWPEGAVCITGPSGSGKTTLLKRLAKDLTRFTPKPTSTSRDMRPGEVDGVDYIFHPEAYFHKGAHVGLCENYGNYYSLEPETLRIPQQSYRIPVFTGDLECADALRDYFRRENVDCRVVTIGLVVSRTDCMWRLQQRSGREGLKRMLDYDDRIHEAMSCMVTIGAKHVVTLEHAFLSVAEGLL